MPGAGGEAECCLELPTAPKSGWRWGCACGRDWCAGICLPRGGLLQSQRAGRVVVGVPALARAPLCAAILKNVHPNAEQGEMRRINPTTLSSSHSDFRAEEEVTSWGFFFLLLFQR